VLQDIADYVHSYEIKSDTAFQTARLCLMDSLGCHMEALRFPGARAVTGPVVEGTIVPNGAKVSTGRVCALTGHVLMRMVCDRCPAPTSSWTPSAPPSTTAP
jgi:hypothetical protein